MARKAGNAQRAPPDPEKIYWTDGAYAHTFIGYSLPAEDYHWETDNGNGTYAGELGYGKEVIDFTAGNDEIMKGGPTDSL